MVPLPADARVCMLSVSLTIHVDVFYHLALMCAFYHFRDSKRIFQDGADERLIYATTLLEYRALSLRVKKRSSSTLALNKSGEGYKKSMFRTSSDGLLETPLQQHYRSLLLHKIYWSYLRILKSRPEVYKTSALPLS